MTTSALVLIHLVASAATAILWLAAAVTVGGRRSLDRTGRLLSLGLAAGALLATVGVVACTIALAGSGWWFAGEKVVLGAPLAVLAAAIGVTATVLMLRRGGSDAGIHTALFAAGYAAGAGCLTTVLLGFPLPVVGAVVLVVLAVLATALTWAVLSHRTRRTIIGFAGAVAIALVAPLGWAWLQSAAPPAAPGASGHIHGTQSTPAAATVSVDDLRMPDSDDAPVRRFELTASVHDVTLPSGRTVSAWGYGGDDVPGPELRVREGETVETTLRNEDIAEGVTVHWHGYDVPAAADGVAGVTQDAVPPGGSFVYRFSADDPGTYWYHTHQASSSGVQRGLYGMLVVEPAAGVEEAVDISAPVHTIGGRTLVGASDEETAYTAAPGDRVRVRVVDTDQIPHRVLLGGTEFEVAAVDGRDVQGAAPVTDAVIPLAAGGRVDLVFTMPEESVTLAVEGASDAGIRIDPNGTATDTRPADFGADELDLLSYGTGQRPALADASPTVEATMTLDRAPRFLGGVPAYAYTVNGQVHPHIDPIVVREGDRLRLTIVNRGTEVHPMHVHGHHALVLSRNGVAASGSPLWLDSIDVEPGDVWVVALEADNPGIWMDHCHNLAHAAEGMMMALEYAGVESPYRHGGEHGNRPE